MPKRPAHASRPLPKKVALDLARRAGVPNKHRASFCDIVWGGVQAVWDRDRRGKKPGPALVRAAEAARKLHKVLVNLSPDDRAWAGKLLAKSPWYRHWIPELSGTTYGLAHLLSTAQGKVPPRRQDKVLDPHVRGRRRGTVKDVEFRNFVVDLLVAAAETDGQLTLEKNLGTGSLIDALNILRPYLPKGIIPNVLPLGTLQTCKTNYRDYYTGLADLQIFPPDSARRTRK